MDRRKRSLFLAAGGVSIYFIAKKIMGESDE